MVVKKTSIKLLRVVMRKIDPVSESVFLEESLTDTSNCVYV